MTNWEKLFGTPERAAQTLACIPCAPLFDYCKGCPLEKPCNKYDGSDTSKTLDEVIFEWLKGECND